MIQFCIISIWIFLKNKKDSNVWKFYQSTTEFYSFESHTIINPRCEQNDHYLIL